VLSADGVYYEQTQVCYNSARVVNWIGPKVKFSALRGWFANPAHVFAALLACIPAVFLAAFMVAYHIPFPTSDTLNLNLPLVIAAAEGRLNIADLFAIFNGHRHATSTMTSVTLYYLTGWNLQIETALLYLTGLVNTTLFVMLFARHPSNRPWLHFMLVAAALLTLSPQQGVNWIATIFLAWHHNLLVVLAVLVSLAYLRPGWRGLTILIALSLVGPYTVANGLLVWGVGLVGMWLAGYRRLSMFLIYIAFAALSAWLYLQGGEYGVGGDDITYSTLVLLDPSRYLDILLIYLGNGVSFESIPVARVVGTVGLITVVVNMVFLYRWGQFDRVRLWLPLVLYNIGTGLLISASRGWDGIGVGIQERFQVIGLSFWAAVVAVMLIALRSLVERRASWMSRVIMTGDLVLLAIISGLFGFTAYSTTPTLENGSWPATDTALLERAFIEQPFLNPTPNSTPPRFDEILAVYDLAGYRGYPYAQWKPLQLNEPVLIAVRGATHAASIRAQIIPPEATVIHLLDEDAQPNAGALYPHLPAPPQQVVYGDAVDVRSLMGDPERFSVVVNPARSTWEPYREDIGADYAVIEQQTFARPLDLVATRYTRTTGYTPSPVIFGERIALESWRIPTSLSVAPCETVTLQTRWSLVDDSPSTDNNAAGVAFVLATTNGEGIARAEGATPVLSSMWQPVQAYADQRTLTVPCETSPGDYVLMLGAYDFETTDEWPAFYPDGRPVGGLVYLTNLTVN
jgi:hypothetical protein